jgi:hypothetical protein
LEVSSLFGLQKVTTSNLLSVCIQVLFYCRLAVLKGIFSGQNHQISELISFFSPVHSAQLALKD